ncbi:hypothetical protein CEXT_377691 [Caerostris extrusa]|uniref:Uncharacterized protein n=1 Tax=Caerostris extrusa TaxID=172846 RepID=A0AAV4S2L9_CAEEX|nr:hypothetical protein CEXT_377691 [Caerostris extrusa]
MHYGTASELAVSPPKCEDSMLIITTYFPKDLSTLTCDIYLEAKPSSIWLLFLCGVLPSVRREGFKDVLGDTWIKCCVLSSSSFPKDLSTLTCDIYLETKPSSVWILLLFGVLPCVWQKRVQGFLGGRWIKW